MSGVQSSESNGTATWRTFAHHLNSNSLQHKNAQERVIQPKRMKQTVERREFKRTPTRRSAMFLRTHADAVVSSPMPVKGLPGPPAGLPDYSGGHPSTGSLMGTGLPLVQTSERRPASPALAAGSSSFAKSLYGPEYWRSWAEEAVIGSDLAMQTILAGDHAEQVSSGLSVACATLPS